MGEKRLRSSVDDPAEGAQERDECGEEQKETPKKPEVVRQVASSAVPELPYDILTRIAKTLSMFSSASECAEYSLVCKAFCSGMKETLKKKKLIEYGALYATKVCT